MDQNECLISIEQETTQMNEINTVKSKEPEVPQMIEVPQENIQSKTIVVKELNECSLIKQLLRKICLRCDFCWIICGLIPVILNIIFIILIVGPHFKNTCREQTCNYTTIDIGTPDNYCNITVNDFPKLGCIARSNCCDNSNTCSKMIYSDHCYVYDADECPLSYCPRRTWDLKLCVFFIGLVFEIPSVIFLSIFIGMTNDKLNKN